jgi:hypothetical protein
MSKLGISAFWRIRIQDFISEIPEITKCDTVVGEDATSVSGHWKFGFWKAKSRETWKEKL